MALRIHNRPRFRLPAALLAAAAAWMPGSVAAQNAGPAPDSVPTAEAPPIDITNIESMLRDSLVELAREQLGARYVYGGESPESGFDCSGLVQYVLSQMEIEVPRTAARQALAGSSIPRDTSALLPGDIVTFGKGTRASHVGIYVGDGYFIHASSVAGHVIQSRLIRPPARRIKPWRGARRLVTGLEPRVAADDTDSSQEAAAHQ